MTQDKLSHATDLTQRPPRSARQRLGGYAILPRMLDKGRATINGKNGEYHFNCPLDQHVVNFIGFDAAALLAELALGKGDEEILLWLAQHGQHQRTPWEIGAWSSYHDTRGPNDVETREFFNGLLGKLSKTREDVSGWFDLLDLDDHVSYGGQA